MHVGFVAIVLMMSERHLVCYKPTELWQPPLQALFTRGHYTAAEARQQMMPGAGSIFGLDAQQSNLLPGSGSKVWPQGSWLEAVLAQAVQ